MTWPYQTSLSSLTAFARAATTTQIENLLAATDTQTVTTCADLSGTEWTLLFISQPVQQVSILAWLMKMTLESQKHADIRSNILLGCRCCMTQSALQLKQWLTSSIHFRRHPPLLPTSSSQSGSGQAHLLTILAAGSAAAQTRT